VDQRRRSGAASERTTGTALAGVACGAVGIPTRRVSRGQRAPLRLREHEVDTEGGPQCGDSPDASSQLVLSSSRRALPGVYNFVPPFWCRTVLDNHSTFFKRANRELFGKDIGIPSYNRKAAQAGSVAASEESDSDDMVVVESGEVIVFTSCTAETWALTPRLGFGKRSADRRPQHLSRAQMAAMTTSSSWRR
jgi:hypothetical protein